MADDDTVTFTIGKNQDKRVWSVAERVPVRTPDGKDHQGLFEAIRVWFGGNPNDNGKKLRLEERDHA